MKPSPLVGIWHTKLAGGLFIYFCCAAASHSRLRSLGSWPITCPAAPVVPVTLPKAS
jgi:hypothetical protein